MLRTGAALAAVLALVTGATAAPSARPRVPAAAGAALQRSMVWLAAAPTGVQTYAAFRRCFDLGGRPVRATVRVFADTRYILWINGRCVERGPQRFDPRSPAFDEIDAAPHLRAGRNCIAVLVHHYHDGRAMHDGAEFNGRTMRHAPGLALTLEARTARAAFRLRTDDAWRGSTHTRFQPSPISWGCIPDRIDARLDTGNWTRADFDDRGWDRASRIDGGQWGPLRPRSIPRLRETAMAPRQLVRAPGVTGPAPIRFPLELRAGEEALIDAGASTLAYDEMALEADAGSELRVSHGLGLARGAIQEVSCENRYVARAGLQSYVSGDVSGFRYLHLRVETGRVKVLAIVLMERRYPLERVGRFRSSDRFLNELWDRSLRTVELCSEDSYTDCSSRERTGWMGDAAVCEYPLTRAAFAGPGTGGRTVPSDPRLMRELLRHIALSQQPDGRVKAHHPSDRWDIHGYIEDYACLWVQMIRACCDNTGDWTLARELWPAVTRQLQWFLDRRQASGLVKAREFLFFDNPISYRVAEGATLNACLVGALRDASAIARRVGAPAASTAYAQASRDLASAINRTLWIESAGAYSAGIVDGAARPPSAHAAMTAMANGVVPPGRRARTLRWLTDHAREVGSPYASYFLLGTLLRADDPALDLAALRFIRERWASTLARTDLDTVTEGFGGGALCHNSGATAAAFLATHVLGVRRGDPVSARRVIVEPHLGDLRRAEGVVETELGPVPVAWTAGRGALTFRVMVPAGASAELRLPRGRVTLGGHAAAGAEHGNRTVIRVGPGAHTGTVALSAGPLAANAHP